MLFRKATWPGLTDGSVTVAVRWWKRPTVKAGGTLRTPAGMLAIDSVEVVEPGDLTDDDARRAGHADLAALLADLGPGEPGRRLHRVTFHPTGDDPRDALRRDDDLDAEVITTLIARLDRMDRAAPTPWTRPTLRIIAERPGVVSTDLAANLGMERPAFKANVRKLKALGLTESLEVGYRLSPRGAALLAALDISGDGHPPGVLPG